MAAIADNVNNDISISDVKVDPQFRNLCPALPDERLRGLTDDIIRDGRFTDPILAWRSPDGTLFLLDGHTRRDIWLNGNLSANFPPPRIELIDLPDADAAFSWIYRHQQNRRNWTPEQAAYARGKKYQREKKSAAGRPKSGTQNTETPVNTVRKNGATVAPLTVSTAERVAKDTGVSTRTIKSDKKYAVALDRIGSVNSKVKSGILNGSLKLSKKDVVAIGQRSEEEINKAVDNVRNGRNWHDDGKPLAPVPPAPSNKEAERLAWNRQVESFARTITSMIDDAPVGPWLDESRLGHVANQLKSAAATARQVKCHALTKPGCTWDRATGYAPKHVIDQHYAQ